VKRAPKHATAAERARYTIERSNYVRLRKKPAKACVLCHDVHPNTQEHFERGPTGWLTSTCKTCSQKKYRTLYDQKAGGKHTQACPICRQKNPLVRDLGAPQVVWLCRRCLVATNLFDHAEVFERLTQYICWKHGWAAEPVTAQEKQKSLAGQPAGDE